MTTRETEASRRTRWTTVWSLLRVRRGEEALVLWTSALFAAAQANQGLGLNTADTLFFLRFGVEFLPTMIVIAGPVVMVGTFVYSVGLGGLGSRKWLPATFFGLGGFLVFERAGIAVGLPVIFPIVWLGGQVVMMLSLTAMWTAAGEVCTTRQAKRLYPLFASAGIAGGVIGNALTGPLAGALGTENLLLIQAGLLVTAAALSLAIGRRYFEMRGPVSEGSAFSGFRAGLETTRGSRLLRLVAWVGVAFGALLFLVVFPFSEIVAGSFETEAEVASFLGFFSAAATAASFAVSLLATNRLFARLGVVATLLVVPVVYAGGFSLWLSSFGLVTATLVRGLQFVAVNAIGGTAWSSLFNVLPARRRGQVMAFMAAGPMQLGTMLSGGLLLLGAALPERANFALGLGAAIAALMLVWGMRSAYGNALVEAVQKGLVGLFTAPTTGLQKPPLDADIFKAMSACLDDPRPEARSMAVAMLSRLQDARANSLIVRALEDEAPRVRSAALEGLSALDDMWVEHTPKLLSDSSPEIRYRTLELIWESSTSPHMVTESALIDPEPDVRSMAAVIVGGVAGRDVVSSLLGSAETGSLIAGVRAVSLRSDLSDDDLARFIDHPDRHVRAAVAGAIGVRPGAAGRLRPLLDDPSILVRRSAADALASSTEGFSTLLHVLEEGSVRATDAALRAFTESGGGGEDLTRWVSQEISRASYLQRHRQVLERDAELSSSASYLLQLLKSREERLERWAVLALASPDTQVAMRAVVEGIWAEDLETRSQAMEALDSIDSRSVVGDLLALLEEDVDHGSFDQRTSLRQLATDLDYWIRALSFRCLGEELMRDLSQLLDAAEQDPSSLVRDVLSRWELLLMQQTETLDLVQQVLALQRVPIFAGIDPEDLERIAQATTERHYEPEEVVFRQGDEGDEMLVIIRGEVLVSREIDGEKVLIRTLGEGEHVGELSLLLGRPRLSEVTAGLDGFQALVLKSRELQAILEERPEAAMAMLGTLAQRLATS